MIWIIIFKTLAIQPTEKEIIFVLFLNLAARSLMSVITNIIVKCSPKAEDRILHLFSGMALPDCLYSKVFFSSVRLTQ